MMFNRESFPIFNTRPNLRYFDNASTTHIHESVLEAITTYYTSNGVNPGRGDHELSDTAYNMVEYARAGVADYIGTNSENIIFTTGATQGLNWIANWLRSSDTIIVSELEHVSNIAPWLNQGRSKGSGLQVIDVDVNGQYDLDQLEKYITDAGTGVLSISTRSNVTGLPTNWYDAIMLTANANIKVCLDISQDATILDFENTDLSLIDFMVFSGHKMFGPSGVGVIYARQPHELEPIYSGGGMVDDLTFTGFTSAMDTRRHQAGSPNTANIIGLGTASRLLNEFGHADRLEQYFNTHMMVRDSNLLNITGLNLIGSPDIVRNIYCFKTENFSADDLSVMLHQTDIAVRTGFMCAHPYSEKLNNMESLLRISTAPYNTHDDCIVLVNTLSDITHKLTPY